ncbi:MAG: transglycosylase family protein [Actinomycetota bacterium]
MPFEFPIAAARPERGVLLAVLMGLLTIGLIVGFGSTDEPAAIETVADEPAGNDDGAEPETAAAPVVTAPAAVTTESSRVLRPRYEQSVGALEGLEPQPSGPTQGVLSAAPEPPPTTAPPAPTTTAPPAETTTTTADPDASTSSTDTTAADGETTTTAPGETTTPEETTTTTASANPDGYVDAGHGVFVPEVLLRIRFCESTDNYQAANPSSSARGAYQFLTGSWAGYGHADRYGVSQAHLATNAQQDEAALITWQRDGTRPWNASKSCWDR